MPALGTLQISKILVVRLILSIFLFLYLGNVLGSQSVYAQEQENGALCPPTSYRLVYFNGVGIFSRELTPLRSWESALATARLVDNEFEGGVVSAELAYNPTDGLNDLLEVFQQRADVADPSGTLRRIIPLMWAVLIPDVSAIRDLASVSATQQSEALMEFGEALSRDVAPADQSNSFARSQFQAAQSLSGAEDVVSTQSALVKSLLATDQRVILVGHSQGNLFLSRVFDNLSDNAGRNIRVLHVAPANPFSDLRGQHVLVDNDFVINEILRGIVGDVALPTEELSPFPNSDDDKSNHGYLETYLDVDRPAREFTRLKILQLLGELERRPCRVTVRYEAVTTELENFWPQSFRPSLNSRISGLISLSLPPGSSGGRITFSTQINNGRDPRFYFTDTIPETADFSSDDGRGGISGSITFSGRQVSAYDMTLFYRYLEADRLQSGFFREGIYPTTYRLEFQSTPQITATSIGLLENKGIFTLRGLDVDYTNRLFSFERDVRADAFVRLDATMTVVD